MLVVHVTNPSCVDAARHKHTLPEFQNNARLVIDATRTPKAQALMLQNTCYICAIPHKYLILKWKNTCNADDTRHEHCEHDREQAFYYLVMSKRPKPDTLLFKIIENAYYLVWWLISDLFPVKMKMCETLASIVCDTSLLKTTDYRIKKTDVVVQNVWPMWPGDPWGR